jgi:hypothetical protein
MRPRGYHHLLGSGGDLARRIVDRMRAYDHPTHAEAGHDERQRNRPQLHPPAVS